MKGFLVGIVTGTVVLFAWGFVSWTILDLHEMNDQRLPAEVVFSEGLKISGAKTGVYFVPALPKIDPEKGADDPHNEAAVQTWSDHHRRGPIVFLAYNDEGKEPMPPAMFWKGGLLNLIAVFLAAILLASAAIRNYPGRVLFVATLGVLIAVVADGNQWNWFYFPTDWAVASLIDKAVGWLLVGLVLGAAIRPPRPRVDLD